MPKIIPVPVYISVGVPSTLDPKSEPRIFGRFMIVPYATPRNGALDIDRWMLVDSDGENIDLNDRLLFNVLPRKLLCHVCRATFETERPSIPVLFIIDEERWSYQMRARELEYEQVHYEIEIVEGEWLRLTEAYVGDVLGPEQFAFAEREILPSIDFGHAETIYEDMA